MFYTTEIWRARDDPTAKVQELSPNRANPLDSAKATNMECCNDPRGKKTVRNRVNAINTHTSNTNSQPRATPLTTCRTSITASGTTSGNSGDA